MTLTGVLSVKWWGQKPDLPESEVIREIEEAAGQLRVNLMSEVMNVKICPSSHGFFMNHIQLFKCRQRIGRELYLTRAVQ